MESKEPEEKCSETKTGEETLNLDKKRSKSRRVSFAETTAIHLFIREEESETPPQGEGPGKLTRSESDEIRALLADDDGDDHDHDDSDEEQSGLERSFLRPFESPSSGSNFGSATSNDEDNFFGPVSADFIKPPRLSDSAISDDNHDVTMDSTAFSMHFRSLARSESGGEFKTPTGIHVKSSGKNLDQTFTPASGDSMSLTASKKRVDRSSFRADTITNSGNSDDMSIVVENPRKYDYGDLPTELDVLLVEDGNDKGVSLSSKEQAGVSIDHQSANDPTKSPILQTIVVQDNNDEKSTKGEVESTGKYSSPRSNSQYNHIHGHPIANSVSSLLSKSPQILSISPKYKSNRILSEKKLSDNANKQVLSASSFEKSVSRLKRFEAFPFGSASKVESNGSRLMPPESLIRLKRNHLINKLSNDDLINQVSYVDEDNNEFQSAVKKGQYDLTKKLSSPDKSTKDSDVNNFSLEISKEKQLGPYDNINIVQSAEINCSLMEISNNDLNCNRENRNSPLTKTERNVSDSPLYVGSLFKKPNEQKGSILRVGREFLEKEENSIASRSENCRSLYIKKNLEVERSSPKERHFESTLIDEESENVLISSRALPINNHIELPIQKASNVNGSDHSSALKRKLFNEVDDCVDDVALSLHKSKVCKEQKHSKGQSNVPDIVGGESTTRDWINVFTSFSGMTNLFPPSIDKLDLSQIRMLIDNLVHLEKSSTYELLHCEMSSQRAFDPGHRSQMKRRVDRKLLLYKILYQKAKLQLMNLECEKLRDYNRQLNSRVEESKNLISSFHGSQIGQKGVEIDVIASCQIDRRRMSLGVVDVPSLREELISSEQKIRKLHDHFHNFTNVRKGLSDTEIIVHVRKFFNNRAACRSLRSEFQFCQVGSIEDRDGKLNILLDYAGIMAQRFVKSLSTSHLYVSNTLNDVKISKMFPGMDACAAFSFVLCGSYSGYGSITQQVQKSTSLLHTLLDVVDEVGSARFKLRNLTSISFLQPSGEKLELELSFTDFRSFCRVVLSIDLTCLKWGIYPSKVLPYEVKGTATKKHNSYFQSLIDDIKSAMNGVKFGYGRILSLCQCVSRTIQDNNRSLC